MGLDSLDLLQFHWWDYDNPYYMDALKYLSELRDQNIIKHIGLTNFDTEHMQIIINSGLQILSNQIQYSIIDRRAEVKMVPFCNEHNIRILAYGSLCVGLLSERYLRKMKEPYALEREHRSSIPTRQPKSQNANVPITQPRGFDGRRWWPGRSLEAAHR